MSAPPIVSPLLTTMDAIAAQLRAVLLPVMDDLQIEARMLFAPTPPSIDVYPADPFLTDMAFGSTSYEALFTIRARVSTADNEGGQELLVQLLDPTSDVSVLAALASDATFGGAADDSTVEIPPSGFILYTETNGGFLLGCEWRARVLL